MEWLIISGYGIALFLISIFSLGQLNLAFHYLRGNLNNPVKKPLKDFPFVTIQLPIYNERYVVERLIDAVALFDYPKDKFEIQVLDDSSDDTSAIISDKIESLKESGIALHHIRRSDRNGFKAGALQYGLGLAKGNYIAIFDADFLPNPDFLLRTLPYFNGMDIGMVQTKWSHLNEKFSMLTKMQAFGLNAHFSVEQSGRQNAGSFINFNGTGGVWKKECIVDAGGWQFDTLTEDLDLSYRAQLKGWKMEYLENVESPAELPVIIEAIKSQQYRWNKGAAETARKILPAVIKSDLSIKHKIRAILHLLNSAVFLFLLVAAILSIPMLYIKADNPTLNLLFNIGSIFLIGFIAIGIFYWVSSKANNVENTLSYFLYHFPLFMIFSMGLALHNSIAILEGWSGVKTPFIRTPKFNIIKKTDLWKGNVYIKNKINYLSLFEGLLSIYFVFGIIAGIQLADYGLIFFHLMLSIGFGSIFILSMKPIRNAA